jgi:hypothetical protein
MLGDGNTLLFWQDPWLDGRRVADMAPELLAVVPSSLQKSRTVASALAGNSWFRDVTCPRTIPVLVQFVELREQLQAIVLQEQTPDLALERVRSVLGKVSLPGTLSWSVSDPGRQGALEIQGLE